LHPGAKIYFNIAKILQLSNIFYAFIVESAQGLRAAASMVRVLPSRAGCGVALMGTVVTVPFRA
jgi:hypothetical protein